MPADTETAKSRAAVAGAALVCDGMTVGLGSGTTAALLVRRLAARVEAEKLKISAVSSSDETTHLAGSLGITVYDLDEVLALDISLDGADEIDPAFRMLKGRGGALLREKLIASASNHRVTMITADKRVPVLGTKAEVPVEVSAIGLRHTDLRLKQLGCTTTLRRLSDGSLFTTDGGNRIIDCRFGEIADPQALDWALQTLPGVLDTGIFIGLCDTLIVGTDSGVEQLESGVRPCGDRLKNPAAT